MRGTVPSADTVIALATPPGRGALALLRLSGDRTRQVLRRLAPGMPDPPPERRPVLSPLLDADGCVIDRGLVTFYCGPRSFTGEDVGEISIHGNLAIAEQLMRGAFAAGARAARPGEFSERAYLAGKIDLIEAEAIRRLIEARTAEALRVSAAQLSGRLSALFGEVREALLVAATHLTATIDFVEDVGPADRQAIEGCLVAAVTTLARLSRSYDKGRLLVAGGRAVILGRPNSGKSTLFNTLLGAERAIVTPVPGTTRDTLEEVIDIMGVPVRLVDTAGLRETEELVERIGVDRSRGEARRADAILYLFDAAVGFSVEDDAFLRSVAAAPVVLLANKADLGIRPPLPAGAIAISARDEQAGEIVRPALGKIVAGDGAAPACSEMIVSLRQYDLVTRAAVAVEQALTAFRRGKLPEYTITHVEDALDALADIVGETTAEEVLTRIFSSFCIGK